jgi:hemolysin III
VSAGTQALVKPRLRGVSHLVAFAVAVVAAAALLASAAPGDATIAASVYGTTLVGVFGASALYHRGNWSPATGPRLLQLDHTAIFCFIAGTYTPVALLALDGTARDVLLPLVWLIAVGGIVFEWLPVRPPRGYVTTVYLVLGWIGAFAIVSVWDHVGATCALLLAAGGLAYTAGAIVHATRVPDPWPAVFGYHEVFHLFVILAAALQYTAIARYVVPLGT